MNVMVVYGFAVLLHSQLQRSIVVLVALAVTTTVSPPFAAAVSCSPSIDGSLGSMERHGLIGLIGLV
jgi:hypothetical protein